MRYGDLNREIKQRFVKEVLFEYYPFTLFDLEDFENLLDFKILSKNHYIDWTSDIIEKYKDKWDWNEIEENPIVCKEVNLGLLYPDKVSLSKPKCNCQKHLDYCDMKKFCNSEYDKTKMRGKPKKYLNPSLYTFIKYLINDKVIDNQMLSDILLFDIGIEFGEDYKIEVNKIKNNLDSSFNETPF